MGQSKPVYNLLLINSFLCTTASYQQASINISDFYCRFNKNVAKISTKTEIYFILIHKNSFLTYLNLLIYNWFGVLTERRTKKYG
jgi:hypothetical protein